MPQPSLSPLAQSVYDELGLATYADEGLGWPLLYYVQALCAMFDQVDTLVRDQDDGTPGWGIALDATRCPSWALPWLAQFAGTTLNPTHSVAQQRVDIVQQSSWQRGSIPAMISAAQATLTGAQSVTVVERNDGTAYSLGFNTRTSETPSPAATLAALNSQKPAGLILTLNVIQGESFLDVRNRFVNFEALKEG